MIKWNKLSQDNKVKLIIVILGAIFSVVGYFGKGWFPFPSNPTSDTHPETFNQPTPIGSTLSITRAPEEKLINAPNISGRWTGNDGSLYIIKQYSDGTFAIESPGYEVGKGEFIPKMPGKFHFSIPGKGYGEYTVSSKGLIGSFGKKGASIRQYETLRKTE